MEKYYVTTAIDYANAAPHIGHAYEKIAADIVARYQRLCGKKVFFLTGTDEHGSKVQKAAIAAGFDSPRAFVDETSSKFKEAWRRLLISNDYFIRTTEDRHKEVVQEVFRRMRQKGDVYIGKYSGLYCDGCEDYLRETDLVDGKCINHQRPPVHSEEENYFFRLTKYKEPVRQWLLEQEAHVLPAGRKQEVLNQLDDPELGDFSITRSRRSLTWGIPVPDDPEHVIYVWIDALTNYITGAGFLSDEEAWSTWWPADLHLIGKDITKFHAIYWPAMLLACDIPLPRLVFGHGFITVEGQKMSKSLGNVLDPVYLTEKYGADAIRYFLFAANTFDQDGDFSRAEMIKIANSHLANNLGNLLNRIVTLIGKNFTNAVPDIEAEQKYLDLADAKTEQYCQAMNVFEFAKAIRCVLDFVDEGNKYLADQKPWSMFKEYQETKDEAKLREAGRVLVTGMKLVKRAAILLAPVTPDLSEKIWKSLGYTESVHSITFNSSQFSHEITPGQVINNPGPVFPRLEEKETE
ncbi:MAG: methionine--tRNA ligase [Candidatus Obscuribacterales bacterium]|nr:methionine--tRNA ligase [Candidatus Obscuribacterales bacterium]